MHAPLVTFALLGTSVLALQGTSNNPRSYGAMLPRGNGMSKRQGYYPSSSPCNGEGDTCAEVCGADQVQCPSDSTFILSCHSTNDGSHCCTDGTGNACGPGDYCTNDGAGQTYCCPENLNAEECAKAFGVDVTLIPDGPASATEPVPSPSATDDAETTDTDAAEPTPVETESEAPSSSVVAVSSPASSKGVPSVTPVVPVVPSVSRSSGAAPSRTPNATTTGSSLPEFTAGAAKLAGAGAAVAVAIAGLAML